MKLEDYLNKNDIPYNENVPLSRVTGMNLRGSLPIIAKPSNIESLSSLYKYLITKDYTYEFVGGLSNTYLCENFCRDILVQTTHVSDYVEKGSFIEVGSGYNLTKLAKELSSRGITGYEGFIGIPGTIGAAAINNSSAFGSAMEDVVIQVDYVDKKGKEISLKQGELKYQTRESILKGTNFGVLTSVTLDVSRKDLQKDIDERIKKISTLRKKLIDGKRKSLGSVIVGPTLPRIWDNHKIALYVRKALYAPFKYTPLRKKMDCYFDFLVLGRPDLARHCDTLGRFCWTKETTEKDFFDYIAFLRKISADKIKFEIEIKR